MEKKSLTTCNLHSVEDEWESKVKNISIDNSWWKNQSKDSRNSGSIKQDKHTAKHTWKHHNKTTDNKNQSKTSKNIVKGKKIKTRYIAIFKETIVSLKADFWTEMMKSRRQEKDIFKELKIMLTKKFYSQFPPKNISNIKDKIRLFQMNIKWTVLSLYPK